MNSEMLRNLDALLVSNQTNVRYLSGFVPVEEGHREAQLLLASDQTILFTNSLYREKANKLAQEHENMKVVILLPDNPLPAALASICKDKKLKRLGFEEHTVTFAEHNKLSASLEGVQLIPSAGRIEETRMIKGEKEITSIRNAAKLTDACYEAIKQKIKRNVSERMLAWEIESFIRTAGHELAFAPIVAFNGNASQPHYSPSDSCTLAVGSLVLLDFGARVNGYCADMTRVFFFGPPKKEWELAYAAVLAAQEKALSLLLSGERSGLQLDKAAKEEITQRGFPLYEHSLGHNLGLDIHEAPRLSIHRDEQLQTGMVFSVEPGLYMEGQYGIRIEDIVYLGEKGPEILSASPKTQTVISP